MKRGCSCRARSGTPPGSTSAGLNVRAGLDDGHYPKATKIGDQEMAAPPLEPDGFHGNGTSPSDR